jgi:hypothetical protein
VIIIRYLCLLLHCLENVAHFERNDEGLQTKKQLEIQIGIYRKQVGTVYVNILE